MMDLTTTSGRTHALSPWQTLRTNPFSLMRRMTEEMDRMMGEFTSGRGNGNQMVWAPAIELSQEDGAFVAKAELPGLKPEQVKVEVTDDELVIQGERADERQVNEGHVHLSERQYGSFYRAIALPEGAKGGDAKASFENGVLEVTVPVQEKEKNRKSIPVQASAGKVSLPPSSGPSSSSTSSGPSGNSGKTDTRSGQKN